MRIKIWSFCLFLFLLYTCSYSETGSWVLSDIAGNREFASIRAIDTLNYLSASNNYFTSNNVLSKTTDGGVSWYPIYDKSARGDDSLGHFIFTDLAYIDVNNIIAVSDRGLLFKTNDAGKTWKFIEFDNNFNIRKVEMADDAYGWLYGYKMYYLGGGNIAYQFSLFKTIDGGNTWTGDSLLANEKLSGIKNLINKKKNLILVFSTINRIQYLFRSENNGISWEKFLAPIGARNYYFLNDNIGWGAGGIQRQDSNGVFSDTTSENITKTTDGGVTWFTLRDTLANNSGFYDIQFYDEYNGIAYGYIKVLLRTTDGGKTWNYETIGKSNTYPTVSGVAYTSRNHALAFLAQEDMYRYETSTSVLENQTSNTEGMLFPNPATDFLEISYSTSIKSGLGGVSEQNVEIFSVLGVKIPPRLTPSGTPQEENLKIDVSSLPQGIYFVKVGDRVGKFVKM